MKKNLLFLYGEDTYRSRQKLNAIKQKYIDASLGDTNLASIEGEKVTIDELTRQLYALPFLAKSRLVVVENILNAKAIVQEKVLDILDKTPASTVALFYEQTNPDKRTKLYKYLISRGQTEPFAYLEPHQIRLWIRDYVRIQNANIDTEAVELLIQIIGPDLWRMKNELDKLTLYDSKITAGTVRKLVFAEPIANVFNLIDGLGERNGAKAYGALKSLIAAREESLKIIALIARSLRTMAVLKSGRRPPASWKIHPFVAQKTGQQMRNFSESDLKNLYRGLAKIDYLVKTGTMEGETALALFIADATKKG